jgi:hypothetical protein
VKEGNVLAKLDVHTGVYVDLVLQWGLWGSTLNTVTINLQSKWKTGVAYKVGLPPNSSCVKLKYETVLSM